MSILARRGTVKSILRFDRIWGWLASSLLLISMQACQSGLGTAAIPTQAEQNPAASSVSITSTIAVPGPTGTATLTPTVTAAPTRTEPIATLTQVPTATSSSPVVFAAIGDYGSGNQDEADVAKLVLGWQPDFIITLGDNNYPYGEAGHIDEAVGQFYHSFIYPYQGSYGNGADLNRFFPSLGNHDLLSLYGQPYFDYFTLPGNEHYYDFTWGPLHLFALDNLGDLPEGVGESSAQAAWLKAGLAASTSPWNIVYMHYPPYSSGEHGSTDWARWPYAEWGADAVLAGHDHTYERLEQAGLTYFVNGLGGYGRYEFKHILAGSLVRYNSDYGAMRVEAMETDLRFQFFSIKQELIDELDLKK